MFSRTTIASSISSPTHRLSAIIVMLLMVKPKAYMKPKVPISEIGSVRPVITVLRHELRNRNTISMVSAAPSNSVRLTLATDTRIERELSRLTSTTMPGGVTPAAPASAARRPSTTSMVFSPCDFSTDSSTVRWPL